MDGWIYVLKSHQTPNFYLGSTIQNVMNRFNQHRGAYKRWLENKTTNYCSSFEILKYDDVYIEIQNECIVKNKNELLLIEQQYFEELKDWLVNKNAPYDLDDERRITQKKYQDIYRKGQVIKNEISCPCCNQIIILKVSPKIN